MSSSSMVGSNDNAIPVVVGMGWRRIAGMGLSLAGLAAVESVLPSREGLLWMDEVLRPGFLGF